MAKILVVDDERNVLRAFEEILPTRGHEVVAAPGAEDAMQRLKDSDCDLVILDICLPGMNGLDALARIKQMDATLPVIVMTGRSTTNTAIEATKRGAFDYHLKPFEPADMLKTIAEALEAARLMKGHVALGPRPAEAQADAIVGQSPAMRQLYKAIGHVAQTDVTVLVRGESGTGKELVARAIYEHSRRSQSPLIVINCAAIPEPLLESELFGYEPGAFTGATARASANFNRHTGARFFSMKSATFRSACKRKFSACCKSGRFNAWEATRRFKPTCVSYVPRIAIWKKRLPTVRFAKTFITA